MARAQIVTFALHGQTTLLPLGEGGGLVGVLVGGWVGGRGGLNLRTAFPKGSLVAEKGINGCRGRKKVLYAL